MLIDKGRDISTAGTGGTEHDAAQKGSVQLIREVGKYVLRLTEAKTTGVQENSNRR